MIEPTKIFYFIFGLITLAGGVQGFISASSKASLIAGGVSGLLLLVAGYLVQSGKTMPGLILGLVISLALAGRFLPAFFKTHSWWPAGVEGFLAVIGLILSIIALIKK